MSQVSRNQHTSGGSNIIERNSNEEPNLILNDPSTTQLGFGNEDLNQANNFPLSRDNSLEKEFFKDRIISNTKRS